MKDVPEAHKLKVLGFAYKQYSGIKRMGMDDGIIHDKPVKSRNVLHFVITA